METFEQIWETSRSNSWSLAYPAATCAGVGTLVVCSLARSGWLRRLFTAGAILGFSLAATAFATLETQEKWRIRGEWAQTHPERMTDEMWSALSVDGANLTLGPLVAGFQAFVVFLTAACVVGAIRSTFVRRDANDRRAI